MMAGWSMGLEAWLWMAVWTLALTVAVWLLVREPGHHGPEDADAILRARLARGEITEDEFRRMAAALAADPARRHA